jgi:predicted metal-dependent peptidase
MTTSDPLQSWLDSFVADPAFLGRYPYYAAVLARMAPVADPSVDSMAVSLHAPRFYLHVNVDFFVRAPQFVRGILLHEVHHVVLGHLTHPKFSGVEHPPLMELAMEVSANEHVEEPLPDPITWRAFEAQGVRPGQSTMERYEKLVAKAMPQRRSEGRFVDAHPWRTHGRPLPPGGAELARQLLDAATREAGARPHEGKARLLAGRDPGRLLEELSGQSQPREVALEWKTALRQFVARARAPVHTWARPSRRFPGRIGQVPGRIWSPRPVERPRILVAIDTSMSMHERELAEVARQLVAMAEHAQLVVAECDVELTRVAPFDGALRSVKGRGGTDLRPVFAPEVLSAHAADGVVYFTDGQGPFPEAPPPVPVLWVLTKPLDFRCPWGERASFQAPRPAVGASVGLEKAR